jgi:putative redox protein
MDMEITFPGGARVDARMEDTIVMTDQPPQAGGEGSAPSPFALFLASIGTCAGIYVLNFCRQRGIPTDDIRLLQRQHANASDGMVDRIEVTIELPPDFPRQYLESVVRAAELCAVKKHLANPPEVVVSAG